MGPRFIPPLKNFQLVCLSVGAVYVYHSTLDHHFMVETFFNFMYNTISNLWYFLYITITDYVVVLVAISRSLLHPTCFLRLPIHDLPSRLPCSPCPLKQSLLLSASINDRRRRDVVAIHASKGTVDAQPLKRSAQLQVRQESRWVTGRVETKDLLCQESVFPSMS
jgi:hypothetical protein